MLNQNKKLVLIEDLGMKFPKETSKQKARYGLYKCHCGNKFEAIINDVKRGHTKSCKCDKNNKKHNLTNHRLYSVWYGMINRCTNPKSKDYKYYGGRGIIICKEWLEVKNFINDMYPTFIEGLTLDRINVNGNYEPNNCRWANNNIQHRNTRLLQSNNTSGYRGVCWHKVKRKWHCKIMVDYKNKHLGYFNTIIEAAKVYDQYIIDNKLEHTRNF